MVSTTTCSWGRTCRNECMTRKHIICDVKRLPGVVLCDVTRLPGVVPGLNLSKTPAGPLFGDNLHNLVVLTIQTKATNDINTHQNLLLLHNNNNKPPP